MLRRMPHIPFVDCVFRCVFEPRIRFALRHKATTYVGLQNAFPRWWWWWRRRWIADSSLRCFLGWFARLTRDGSIWFNSSRANAELDWPSERLAVARSVHSIRRSRRRCRCRVVVLASSMSLLQFGSALAFRPSVRLSARPSDGWMDGWIDGQTD